MFLSIGYILNVWVKQVKQVNRLTVEKRKKKTIELQVYQNLKECSKKSIIRNKKIHHLNIINKRKNRRNHHINLHRKKKKKSISQKRNPQVNKNKNLGKTMWSTRQKEPWVNGKIQIKRILAKIKIGHKNHPKSLHLKSILIKNIKIQVRMGTKKWKRQKK